MSAASPAPPQTLDDFIERYEDAQCRAGTAELERFLPDPAHPLYREVLRELVRLELEYGWQRGRPTPLADYERRFPELFCDPACLREIAFEEYRLRGQAGQAPSRAEYEQRYGIDTRDWPGPDRPAAAGPRLDDPLGRAARSYRDLRQAHYDDASLERLLGEIDHAQLFRDLHRSDPAAADRLAQALTNLPEVGSEFLGFRLLAELGRGAFSRVYLARQGDLADRPVALKVAPDLVGESQTLAQLQHTHIVPIYSLHRCSPFQAVCMPYFGATTLADVLRALQARPRLPASGKELAALLAECHSKAAALSPPAPAGPSSDLPVRLLERLTYVEAGLWIGARLADGLAHAHERGIIHRDLKPANVLVTAEGQPMLLDFNLSEDTKLRDSAPAASIGGTLPYMAPEHLEAFAGQPRTVDGRGDVYALGVILFELLAGSHPFVIPRGRLDEVLSRMLDERRGPPPDLRRRNPAVSPAAAAIVRRCLEPDLDRRYRTARELQEDLERHLRHLPLRHTPEPSLRERARKWLRRHPRLASSGGVAAVAGAALLVLVLLLAARGQRLARLEAAESAEQFRRELRSIQFDLLNTRPYETAALDAALERCRRLLERHHVLDNPRWQERTGLRALAPEARQRLVREVGELLLLWSRIAAVRADRSGPGAERDELLQTALRLNERAESCYPADQVPRGVWRQRAEVLRLLGRAEEARVLRERAASGPLAGTRDLALRASEYALQGRGREALPLFLQAVREDPTDFWTWFDLGLCYEGLAQDAEAAACFSTCIALAPEFTPLYYKRGLAHLRRNDHEQARADFDRILRDQPEMTEALINRALALIGLREYRLALTDLTRALEQDTPPTRVYFLRARVRELLGDRDGAQRDRVEGLARRPTDEASWVVRGSARMADDPAGALADFDEALALNPRSLTALQNRAHVLAERLGQTDAALETLDRLLEFYPDFVPALAGRGILRARQGRREEALRDAQACLARDSRPEILYQVAGIYALTSRLEPDDRWEALEHLGLALRKGYGLDLIDRDRDLDPIRPLPEFRRLIEKARAASARSGTT